MKFQKLARTVLAALVISTLPAVFGQTGTTGEVTGTVKDTSGAVIPNASITLKSPETGEARTASTESNGSYRFSLLRPGAYTVSAASTGMNSDTQKFRVDVGQALTVDVTLKVQSAATVVEVSETAALLNTESAAQTSVYGADQIRDLPMPGGDTTAIAYSAPGVVMSTGGGYGNFSAHGLPGTSNLFTVNGNDNMDPYLNLNNSGASNLTLGQNEIAEAAVVTNAYAVQFGRQAGAQVSFVTKSGTNDFHGSLLYNFNSSGFNANDFFNNQNGNGRPKAVHNQWAAGIGGPVIKNKLFFYADDEGLRYILPSATNFVSIPSPQLQSYILSTLPANQTAFYQKAFNLWNGAPGAGSKIPVINGSGNLQDGNGNLGCGVGTFTGTPAPGGGTFGVDTPCASAFTNTVGQENDEWLTTVRADYVINDKQRLNARYKTDQGIQATGTDPINPVFNANSVQPAFEGQLNHNYAITPTIVNNAIFAGSWYSALFGPASIAASAAAMPAQLNIFDGGANGSGGQLTTLGTANVYPQGRVVNQWQYTDDLSIVAGRHALKFGANYRYNAVKDTSPGEGSFIGNYSINDLAEFAAGRFAQADGAGSSFTQTYSSKPFVNLQIYSVGYYGQDEWALRPNLKVTFGLRVDTNSNPTCDQNCFSRLYNTFGQVNKGLDVPYNETIKTGIGALYPTVAWFVPQPRLGIVYSPGDRKTVIRTGIGLFSDLSPSYIASSVFRNSPNVFTPNIPGALINASGPGSGYDVGLQSYNAFQSGFGSGLTYPQIRAALAPIPFSRPNFFQTPNNLKNSKYAEYSFEIERQLTSRDAVTVSYTGNFGYDIFMRNLNANAYVSPTSTYAGFGNLPTAAPDPRFRRVTQLAEYGKSNYNGLTVQYRRGLGFGFAGQISYTWSHALDTISNGGLGLFFSNDSLTNQLDPLNPRRLNYSNADYDIRHNLVGDFLWSVPFRFSNPVVKQVLGGWTLGSRYIVRTGTPFSVFNTLLPGRVNPNLSGAILADVLNSSVKTTCSSSNVNTPCFATTDFATTSSQRDFGNLTRNSFRAPGFVNVDVTVYKKFQIGERMTTQFGAQLYNVMNHPNLGTPASNAGAPGGFGVITTTVSVPSSPYGAFQSAGLSGRIIVVEGKLSF